MATSEAIRGTDIGTPSRPKALHIGLWVAQALMALAFGMAGLTKATTPLVDLAQQMPWTTAFPGALVRFIGVAELAAALGLTLPSLARIKPFLTPLAAAGLTVVMLLASLLHATRGELGVLPINATLGAIAALVAWGRYRRAPIVPRA